MDMVIIFRRPSTAQLNASDIERFQRCRALLPNELPSYYVSIEIKAVFFLFCFVLYVAMSFTQCAVSTNLRTGQIPVYGLSTISINDVQALPSIVSQKWTSHLFMPIKI